MDKLKELRAGVDEMRSVAQRLMKWADDLEQSFQEKVPSETLAADAPAPDAPEAPPSRSNVKTLLTKLCAGGYSVQVKALIASFGASSLSAVPDAALGALWDAALLVGQEESGGDADAG